MVCLNAQGDLLHNENYISACTSKSKLPKLSKKINSLGEIYEIEAIAIGNGTASRETERLIKAYSF